LRRVAEKQTRGAFQGILAVPCKAPCPGSESGIHPAHVGSNPAPPTTFLRP